MAGKHSDPPHVQSCQHEHVDIEGRHQHQHSQEHGDEAHQDCGALRVHDEQDAGHNTEAPNDRDDGGGSASGHDVVVAKRVEDGHVAVDRNGQEAADGRQQRAVKQRNWMQIKEELVLFLLVTYLG